MKKLATVLALGLVIAACSPGESADDATDPTEAASSGEPGDVEVDVDNEGTVEMTIQTDDGDATVNIGGGELPDGFPFQIPGGGEIQAVATSGGGNVVSLIYPASQFDEIVDHFADIYASDAGENAGELALDDPPTRSWSWDTPSGGLVSITVQVQTDQALVNIIYGDS